MLNTVATNLVVILAISGKKGKNCSIEVNIWRIKGLSYNTFLLAIILLALSGCNATADIRSEDYSNLQKLNQSLVKKLAAQTIREDSLSARETAVSARETELVTLFSELLKEKKMLEIERSDLAYKKNSERVRTNPTNNKTATAKQPTNTGNAPTIIGGLEDVYLDPPGLVISARIDTGATTSSLNAVDMVEFERDGKPYVKFHVMEPKTDEKIEITRRIRSHIKIKEHKGESQRRPVIRMRIKLGDIDEQIKFTLVDRNQFEQQVLIGRNLLRDLAIVDVSKEYTIPSTTSSQ